MPLYDYRCRACGNTFELLRRIHDSDANLECPVCHSDKIERLLSSFATGGCCPPSSTRFR